MGKKGPEKNGRGRWRLEKSARLGGDKQPPA